MTPIFRRGAFENVWRTLTTLPSERLGSDSGLDILWCGLAALQWPQWPACVVLNTQSVIHTNTHTIHKFDKQEREHYFGPLNLYVYLQTHFDFALRAAYRILDSDIELQPAHSKGAPPAKGAKATSAKGTATATAPAANGALAA